MAEDRKEGLSEGQTMLLWIVGIAGAAFLLSMFKPELLKLWQRCAVWHATVLSDIGDNGLIRAFYQKIGTSSESLARLAHQLAEHDATTFTSETVWKVSEYIGRILRWFIAPALVLVAWDVLSYPRRYRRHFANGVVLFKYVQTNFGRYLARAQNALKSDLYTGPHAVAKTPWQWVSANKCVKADETLDEPRALEALRGQLGPRFTTWEALIKGPRGWIATEILSYLSAKSDRDGVKAYAIRGHAYESTVLVALLLATRRFGVVPCMSFAGLRQSNRSLWYALESAGRRLAFAEGAGIMAQYEYEMALLSVGKGKLAPQEGRVAAAIAGFKEALEIEVRDEPASQGDQVSAVDESVWANYDPTKN